MTNYRRVIPIISVLLFISSFFVFHVLFTAQTYGLGYKYWDDSASNEKQHRNDCDAYESRTKPKYTCGQQNIRSEVGKTRYVRSSGISIRAYFTSNVGAQIVINGVNYCYGTSGQYDAMQSGDYYASHMNELNPGMNVTTFYAATGSFKGGDVYGKYYPSTDTYKDKCAGNNNQITIDVNPVKDKNITAKDLYYVEIYVDPINNSSGFDGIINSFDMHIKSGNGFLIAQEGTKAKSGYDGTMRKVSGPGEYTDYVVKFGTPCGYTSTTKTQKLLSYDLDSILGSSGNAQVGREITTSLEVWDSNGNPVKGDGWDHQPVPNSENRMTPFSFVPKPGYRYKWTMHDVYQNNTIQLSPPVGFNSVYWRNVPDDPLCLNKTYTYPNTTLDNGNVSISATNGSNHTFRHYVDVDRFAPNHGGTVNWKVQTKTNNGAWTDTGRSGTEKIEKDQVDNADALVNTGPYTAPATGEGQYCEQLVLSNPQKPEDVGIRYTTSQALCVNYGSGGPGPGGLPIKTVEFKTQGGGGDVKDEPEVTVDVDGSSLSGTLGVKPNTNELGYQNQSKYIDPQPVYETEHPIGTSTDGEKTVPDDYPATCILRTELVNGSWVPVVPNVCEVYTCPNGGSLSGTTCVKSHQEYHYYCIVTNLGYVDRGWHASDPGCGYSDYDSCPDGTPARLGQPSGQRRACNDAWTCAYGKLWTNVGKPYCEFRCDGGTGNKAILAESRIMTNSPQGNQFETWGNGDTNCYKPWQVTVSCQITYTDNGGRWISSGSRRVVNGTVQTWPETITTDERGNMTSYCNNPPGGYWATQYEYGRVGSQGCMALSLVSISIFTDTPPSPLSPNNRQVKTVYWNRAIVGGAAQKCWTSVGRPYAQFNNTDISTMTCGTGAGNVKMYAMDEYGSSVEYAAYVAGTISSLRTNYNNGSQGLAFASDGSKTIGGGQFASKSGGDCNYYDSLANSSGSFVQSRIKIYDGDITVDQGLVNSIITSTGSYAIFANNITVNGNINLSFKLSNDPNNPNETGAKVLYLIAKNNINVNANVTNLDAMLISNKNINTCSGSPNQCENNLVINGGLAAGTVQFKRTGKSSLNCARPGHGSVCNEYQYPAELINYGAYYELFLPPFKPVSGLDQGRYDSIKSVAPIF